MPSQKNVNPPERNNRGTGGRNGGAFSPPPGYFKGKPVNADHIMHALQKRLWEEICSNRGRNAVNMDQLDLSIKRHSVVVSFE